MSQRVNYSALCCALLLLSPLSLGDAVKWIDEKGRVHYGDRPPENHSGETETVELKEAPKTGMTEAELAEQRKRINSYKAELEREKRLEAAEQKSSTQTSKSETQEKQRPPTREECRNRHPSKTADRVRCFQKAEEGAS